MPLLPGIPPIPYSSSSSSDRLSWIIDDSDEEKIAKEYYYNNMLRLADLVTLQHLEASSSRGPKKRRRFSWRNRAEAHDRLFNDYFADEPLYTEEQFRRRFRMRRHVFLRIVEALGSHDAFFTWRYEASDRRRLSPLTKCTAAIQMLAYGVASNSVDECLNIGESTTILCTKKFAEGIVDIFRDEYLRRPTQSDIDRLLKVAEDRNFPGMLGSIDCMHWEWKNCPIAWRQSFEKGVYKIPTIILEGVASYDTWIWHAFFGCTGSFNDINVLHRSPMFDELYQGRAPICTYVVNGHQYDTGYFLSDGIYPRWSIVVKSIPHPKGPKEKLFSERQASFRKDVERAFDILQSRFTIVRGPTRHLEMEDLKMIIKACVILHNMIVEDERDTYGLAYEYEDMEGYNPVPEVRRDHHPCYETYFRQSAIVRDPELHARLKSDLIEEV